jgi:hypothetical protein
MARKVIDVGLVGNDGTGDSIRDSFSKVNDNFRELYSSLGLGERLTFLGLDDTPSNFVGQEAAVVAVNNTTDGLQFKQITGGTGVSVDTVSNSNQIIIATQFSEISGDPSPQLGGDLSVKSGGITYKIKDLATPTEPTEAANKAYVDTKLSRAGVDAIDPATGTTQSAFGTMSGPLILSRSPEPDDDARFDGLIAATKAYVDGSSFGSSVNLYVATSGADDRPGVSEQLQGRALAYAYKTIEAACKKAEEILLESNDDIGPYKKKLTYSDGTKSVTLASITTSPTSGIGFAGVPRMSVDTISLNSIGTNYQAGDIIELSGGTGDSARYEVLTTVTTPGAIVTFRQISSGNYTVLPGSTNVATTTDSAFGNGATFNVTYKVNNVTITNGGSGHSLVSVRITGGGGSGAFGVATVVAGVITAIEITDSGSGFTSLPTVEADLPRFLLKTEGLRTDFTGDVLIDTEVAFRTRDIREGLYIRGDTSGALAQILAHEGALDSGGNEIFDVDIKYGTFEIDEELSYGDITNQTQISILVESGIYEENYPIKVPQNVAIIGNEFRRVIVKPRSGTSSSPWSFQRFRRDTTIDGLTTASQLYGYHYLEDPTQPVYPKINNGGGYKSSAQLLKLNRAFLQNEITAWINYQIANNIAPFTTSFTYNENLCKRDVGLILDAMIFDLKYGEYNRTISAGLKYYQSASGRIAITTQKSQTIAALEYLESILDNIVNNDVIGTVYNPSFLQITDGAFVKESGTEAVLAELFDALIDVIDGSGSVNYPKDNDKLDVFLCNDAVILRAMTMQGHGGFSMVLDPTGQILAKSPYAQECASFSKSINAQTFAGGMFVDGFAGNLQFTHVSTTSPNRIEVSGLDRFPLLPASFIVGDDIYKINYVRDFVYNPAGSTASLILDETTPFSLTAGAQTLTSITQADPAVFTRADHGLQAGATLVFSTTGTLPSGITAGRQYYVSESGLTGNTFRITELFLSDVEVATTSAGSGTHSYQRIYEILMPGNRSMLSNDFTQIADMGYGLLATNGGLTEAVSMFTYYCYASYISLNGAQIRSIAGSSAHGVYALVAEGSDPLEVPTPTTLYYDVAQRVDCYFPSASFQNVSAGLVVYVNNYDYTPLNNSELEVDHGNLIYRYPVTSVTTQDLPAGVAKLNLTSDETGNFEGLFAVIPNGTKMTLRSNSQIILTGELADVATRPSTGLRFAESPTDVYRVLQFEDYDDEADGRGALDVEFTTATPTVLTFTITVTDISGTDTLTTDRNHGLRTGDTFTPKSTANGLTGGTTYYVYDVPTYNTLQLSTTSGGSLLSGLTNGSGLSLVNIIPHKQIQDYRLQFESTGTLPTGIDAGRTYFVLETNLTSTTFEIGTVINGAPVAVTAPGAGNITAISDGITKTTLRENYDYIDLTVYQPSESVGTTGASPVTPGAFTTLSSISIASPAVFTTSSPHGLAQGDVIRLESTGSLPVGLNKSTHYFVSDDDADGLGASSVQFTVSTVPPALASSVEVDTSGTQSGTHSFAKVLGRVGDSTVTVVPVAPEERSRVDNSKFIYKGEEYIIIDYQSEEDLNENYARITLDRPLEDSVIEFEGSYTIRSAVPIRSFGAVGNLTIRISLTRVTGHDLLDIGTGSYADTNYPNEIYGPPVNALNDSNETVERTVGRVFYVTTDQFGNFNVGPYFRVDQGTGRVTFSAAIALSNLDGIGFKRGVPISEFSTDSSFSDNAVDTVPTENAARLYIERRLGTTHSGAPVISANLIPPISGGFMSLDGQLAMKANMNLDQNRIVNLADPVDPQDAVNLRSLTYANLQEFTFTDLKANDIMVFTGVGNDAINASVVGDITFNIDSTANTIDAQIEPDVILNADIHAPIDNTEFTSGAIVQSKLNMNKATTAAAAPTGTEQAKQGTLGVSSFDSAQFTVVDGWVQLKTNGTPKTALAQITAQSVLGNSALTPGNAADVLFTTVVDAGGSIKKTQYGSVGILARTNASSGTADGDYAVIDYAAGSSSSVQVNKLIRRDSNGDFGGRIIDVQQYNIDGFEAIDSGTSGSGGFVRVHTFGGTGGSGNGGIFLQDGSLAADKANFYDNDLHTFRTQNGLANAPIVASSIQVSALTTGGNTTTGTVTGRWSLTGSSPNESRFEATYSADVAEYYEGDKEYEVGTVLVFGGDKEVTTSNTHMDKRIAGVVSNTAAYVMYTACPGHKNLVALVGRVPCKVVGKIKKGDILVTAGIHGVATVSNDPKVGTIVGKAIEDYDSDHIGTIEIAVGRS